MKNSISDNQKLGEKITESEKKQIKEAISDTEDWLNANQEAEKDDIEEKLKDLQRVCDPIIKNVYQSQGGQGQSSNQDEDVYTDDL